MKSPKIVCLGEALVDRLGPLGGDPGFDKPVTDCFGGAPANVACALARLGVNVSFLGSLGNDSFGQNFKDLMQNRGINITGLQQDNIRPTRIVLVRRDAAGERSFQGFKGDLGCGFADQAISLNQLLKDWSLLASKAQWLVVGTIPLASKISAETFSWCIQSALNNGMKIAVDLNWRPTFWRDKFSEELAPTNLEINQIKPFLNNISLIKLAKEEAQWFFDSVRPMEISSMLPQRPSVIVTDGANPISWLLNNNSGISNAISPFSIVDTTGAGDAFTAGLMYKLLSVDLDKVSNKIAEDIIQFASACGSYVCQGVGAIDSQPYLEDVDKFISSSNGENI